RDVVGNDSPELLEVLDGEAACPGEAFAACRQVRRDPTRLFVPEQEPMVWAGEVEVADRTHHRSVEPRQHVEWGERVADEVRDLNGIHLEQVEHGLEGFGRMPVADTDDTPRSAGQAE